jgi:beta-galactosidase
VITRIVPGCIATEFHECIPHLDECAGLSDGDCADVLQVVPVAKVGEHHTLRHGETTMTQRVWIQVTALLCALCCCAAAWSEHGDGGRKLRFDDDWRFALGDRLTGAAMECDVSDWRTLDLPHDWSIEGSLERNNPSGGAGGYFPAGIGWYRKTLTIPEAWKGKRVAVYFEGVYANSEVFCNGVSLGVHPYGYTSFFYDLTPHLHAKGENVIAVRVDNSQQVNCRWYSGSGIYRHVWLLVTAPIHIDQWGVAITTPEVSGEKATVRIAATLRNETKLSRTVRMTFQVNDKQGRNVGSDELRVTLPARKTTEVVRSITVRHPRLWAPDTPDLYEARIAVGAVSKTIDVCRNTFGFRSLRFSAGEGFLLNGKSIKLFGGCVHHDNGCLGAAAYDRAEERKVELLKNAGFNAVRTSHNPPSEAFLDACDRLGMMVIDEAFDGWKESKNPYDYARSFDAWWQRDLESMIMRDRNHPSIIMWSTGNEILERKKPEAVETAKMLAGCIRRLDATRPVTSAMTTWDKEWEMFDPLMAAHDVCGYNYQMDRAPADHQRVPARIIAQTESFPRDAFSNWSMVQGNSYIIGDFVWTALDYLGESGIGRYYYPGETPGEHWEADFYPWHGAYCGDIDLTGWRKPISHYRTLLWTSNEKLYMAVREPNPVEGQIKETQWSVWPTWESWTWPGFEMKNIQVDVYSRYPGVRLYLDGRLMGEHPTTESEKFTATFSLPYSPGALMSVGVQDGRAMDTTVLRTAGKPAAIRLIADRTELFSDGQDLSYVAVEIVDSSGTIQPNADCRLQFAIEGPGTIAGVDNANLKDLDKYAGSSRKAWHGRAMVVIRSAHRPGEIRLRARCPELPDAHAVIRAISRK